MVGIIRKERTIYSPAGSFRIEQGDTLMLLGAGDDMLQASEVLHGHPR